MPWPAGCSRAVAGEGQQGADADRVSRPSPVRKDAAKASRAAPWAGDAGSSGIRWRDPRRTVGPVGVDTAKEPDKSQTKRPRPQTRGVTRLQPATIIAGRCHTRRRQATSSDSRNLPYKRGGLVRTQLRPQVFAGQQAVEPCRLFATSTSAVRSSPRCRLVQGCLAQRRVVPRTRRPSPPGLRPHPYRRSPARCKGSRKIHAPPGRKPSPSLKTSGPRRLPRPRQALPSGLQVPCCRAGP